MPHLQIEVSQPLETTEIDSFADWVTGVYSDLMATGTGHIAVTVRDDIALSLGRADDGAVAVVNADIRAGRTAEQRRRFATTVMAELADRWGVPERNTYVVFTEHPGEDFHLSEGPLVGWSSEEDGGNGPLG